MEYRTLGNTGLTVSTIGFGAMGAGGGWSGNADDRDVVAAMQRAFDLGVTLFDTAPAYSFGHSEELLAQALGSHRHEVIVATKFGRMWDATHTREGMRTDCSRKRLLFEIDESLRRLKTDHIDIYHQHWPDPNTPLEETMATLVELQQAGKILHIGVSNFNVPLMQETLRLAPVAVNQIPHSMLRRANEAEVLPFCQEHVIGTLIYGPLQHGLLTGKYTQERSPTGDWRASAGPEYQFSADRYGHNLRIVDALRPVAAARGVTLAQLAIAGTLMNSAVDCVLVGAKSPSQMEENAGGAGWRLSDSEMQVIEELTRISYEPPDGWSSVTPDSRI
jgi:aryl-alcohol dehydrogenase-like predicted oxidoreductase